MILVILQIYLEQHRGTFHSFEKAYEIFQNKRIFAYFLWIFLQNKRIFAKSVRDFLGVKYPSNSSHNSTKSLKKCFLGFFKKSKSAC